MQSLKCSEMTEVKKSNKTYIMQGNSEEKVLDFYHLIFAPTHACNLKCRHCYLPDHAKEILPKDIALRLVDEWSEIVLEERGQYGGVFHIKGGEPFVVPYLWDITDRLIELQSLHLMLTTNGTFLEEEIFRKLSNCKDAIDGHVTVIVSLDGATEETHALLRGKGQFTRTLKFIEELQNCNINFYLNCVLHKENISEISAYLALAKKYGATQVNFLSLIPRGNGAAFSNQQIPHRKLYQRLENLYQNGEDKIKTMLAGSLPDIKCRVVSDGCPTSEECVAAYRGLLYITPNGLVFTCPNITLNALSMGNVHRQNLREILKNLDSLYKQLRPYSSAYLCTGERIFYERSHDINKQASLRALIEYLDNSGDERYNHSKSTFISYCYNRNW